MPCACVSGDFKLILIKSLFTRSHILPIRKYTIYGLYEEEKESQCTYEEFLFPLN